MRKIAAALALLVWASPALADGSPEMARTAGTYLAKASHKVLEGFFRDYPATRFRRVYPHIYEAEPGKQFWYLCGEVNTKNGLGGYTGWEPFLITPQEGNQIAITYELAGPYDEATNIRMMLRLCTTSSVAAKNTAYTEQDYASVIAYRH
jgi:hypothetical protein